MIMAKCNDCGTHVDRIYEPSYQCLECDELICEDCRKTCDGCDENFCKEHVSDCAKCNEPVCENCVEEKIHEKRRHA